MEPQAQNHKQPNKASPAIESTWAHRLRSKQAFWLTILLTYSTISSSTSISALDQQEIQQFQLNDVQSTQGPSLGETLFPSTKPSENFDELSTESMLELTDSDFLALPDSPETSKANWKIISAMQTSQPPSETHSLPITTVYTNRPKQSSNSDDWWHQIKLDDRSDVKQKEANKPKKQQKNPSQGISGRNRNRKYKPPVYVEQPLSQNVIMTSRNQLIAIREQHRLLTTKAVDRLVSLDDKLVEGYRTCFKRDMPFHAGLLYRARDYVIKLGRDVKQQRLNLEGWTKRTQKVLKQSVRNSTLVKEYNNLLRKQALLSSKQSNQSYESYKLSDRSGWMIPNLNLQSAEFTQNQIDQTELEPAYKYPKNQKIKNRKRLMNLLVNRDKQAMKSFDVDTEWVYREPKLMYTVNINEVNLRKDLQKSQELIDQIDKAYYEIGEIVDDILMLMKWR